MKRLVEWRSVLGGPGGQCVMTIGIIQKQLLSVDNLDSIQKVNHSGVNDNDRHQELLLSKQLKRLQQVTYCVNTSIL